MTTDLGSRISESDDPEPVDSSLVKGIVDAVNALRQLFKGTP